MNFKIIGNRAYIRSDEEMAFIDKNRADSAFKKYKKEIIDSHMKEQGFLKYKNNSYVRKNKIELLEYIDFQKERHGSKTFTVNLAVLPLYVLHECVSFSFSIRLGNLICNKDIWWDFSDDDICRESMLNVKNAIELFAMQWFGKMEDENYVIEQLVKQKESSKISMNHQRWLDTIKKKNNCKAIIRKNIDKLKLPKKLIE